MKHRLGTTADGGYVVVEIRLEPTQNSQNFKTVDHGPVPEDALRLAITGEHYRKGDRRGDPSSAGQCADALDEVTTPAPGWTLEEIAELKALWDEWHLSDMQAGCSHVPTPLWETTQGYRRPDLKNTPACPETGYRYGSAWLVKVLTPEVLATIERLDRDRSNDLYKARGYDSSGKAV
jgi:hypothetical protein